MQGKLSEATVNSTFIEVFSTSLVIGKGAVFLPMDDKKPQCMTNFSWNVTDDFGSYFCRQLFSKLLHLII